MFQVKLVAPAVTSVEENLPLEVDSYYWDGKDLVLNCTFKCELGEWYWARTHNHFWDVFKPHKIEDEYIQSLINSI